MLLFEKDYSQIEYIFVVIDTSHVDMITLLEHTRLEYPDYTGFVLPCLVLRFRVGRWWARVGDFRSA